MALSRWPLHIILINPDTHLREKFTLIGSKGSWLIYLGQDTMREVLRTPEQALQDERW